MPPRAVKKRKRGGAPLTRPERHEMACALRDTRYCWKGYATRAEMIRGATLSIKYDKALEEFIARKIERNDLLSEKINALIRKHPTAQSFYLSRKILELTREVLALDALYRALSDELNEMEEQMRVRSFGKAGHFELIPTEKTKT